jgi:hypothetical protein
MSGECRHHVDVAAHRLMPESCQGEIHDKRGLARSASVRAALTAAWAGEKFMGVARDRKA